MQFVARSGTGYKNRPSHLAELVERVIEFELLLKSFVYV